MTSRQMHEVRQSLRRIVPPSSNPVSLEEVKRALDLGDDTGSDVELAELIPSAVEIVERDCQRALVSQTWRLTLDAFPHEIELRMPPVMAVESVKHIDSSGIEQTVSSSDYHVDTTTAPGRIWPVTLWPSGVADDRPNAVSVTFTAGYPGSIPKTAWLAIMLALKSLYLGCDLGEAYWSYIHRLRWGPT